MHKLTDFEDYVEEWWEESVQDIMDGIENGDENKIEDYKKLCEKLGIDNLGDLDDGLEIYQKVILNSGYFKPYEFMSEYIEEHFIINYDFQWELLEDIVNHIIEYSNPVSFFEDLNYGGCKSGMIGMFVYNNDCKKFYIKHIDEMEEYMLSLEDELGIRINNGDNLPRYTFVCWVCYEEFCRQLSTLFE